MTTSQSTPSRIIRGTVAVALLSICVLIVTQTRIGPVILIISARHGHGVHLGDLITLPLGLAALRLIWQTLQRRR